MAGGIAGALSGLIAAAALLVQSFPLYCLATLCGGMYAAVVLSFRFAAADGASPAFRAKALSWVMAGGVFAGVIGPQLVTLTMDLLAPNLFVVSYLARADAAAGRPLPEIIRQPRFAVAVLCGVVSYVLMNLVMTSAPLAMRMCGLPLSASNSAIQWHIVAMYGPSFFTGSLIARFGAARVVAAGLLLTACAGAVGLSGITAAHFAAVLVLLGLGWNFGFVGASAMVLDCHRPEERTRVQSFNDFLVFGTMAVGSFSSGHLLTSLGWDAVVAVVFPPVLLALGVLVLTGRLRRVA